MPLSRLFIKIIISFLQRKVNVLYSNSVLEYDKRVTVLHSGVVILYATAGGCRRPHIARTCLKLRYTLRGGLVIVYIHN